MAGEERIPGRARAILDIRSSDEPSMPGEGLVSDVPRAILDSAAVDWESVESRA